MSRQINTAMVRECACGNWLSILERLAPSLGHAISRRPRHVSCPIHGGRDGFRLHNDSDLTGGGVCNTCGSYPDGFALIMWANGWDFLTALKAVANDLGITETTSTPRPIYQSAPPTPLPPRMNPGALDRMRVVWRGSIQLDHPDAEPARQYLFNRGLAGILDDLPDRNVLRYHPGLEYWHDRQLVGTFPALVARVQALDGTTVSVHRTFLSTEGTKANVPGSAKKLMTPIFEGAVTGSAIRLYPNSGSMGVAEGVETALAVRAATGMAMWSCVTAGGLESLMLPDSTRTVAIWADLDASGTGQRSAEALARRIVKEGRTVRIMLPPGPISTGCKKLDWLDIWHDQQRRVA